MGKKVKEYKAGDFIFAKVKGYPAWPARVQRLNGKKYFVYFYGTGETANLPPNMIFDYAENKDKFLTKTQKRRDFNDGVKQIIHDFANNVPLEDVIGTPIEVGAEVPTKEPADDTADDIMDETADTIANDTTANDTIANDTVDATITNITQNEGTVEDSDDTCVLVIDEGKAAKKKGKPDAKTPAKDTPKAKETKTPRGKAKKADNKDDEDKIDEDEERREEEIVSRSGRKIRPKRFVDEQTEENSTLPSPVAKRKRGASLSAEKEQDVETRDKNIKSFNAVTQLELEELKQPFKPEDAEKENILIAYLPSGKYVGIKLFQSRPTRFKNEASRLQWDKQAASNAITLRMQLERGQITAMSVHGQLVMDLNLTDEEKAILDKERDTEGKKTRVLFLKTEMRLIELDAQIKTCLSLEKADADLCLELMTEMTSLDVKPVMLLKHPTVVETVKRLRAYVGNAPSWDLSEDAALQFSRQAHRIRKHADGIYKEMKDMFTTPDGLAFWEFFSERVVQFKKASVHLDSSEILELMQEPIEMSLPSAHTMRAAIDAANEDGQEADTPRRKTPACRARKTANNNTPNRGKRQSTRRPADAVVQENRAEEPIEVAGNDAVDNANESDISPPIATGEVDIANATKDPEEPAIIDKEPAVNDNEPAVNDKEPAVNDKEPAVNDKEQVPQESTSDKKGKTPKEGKKSLRNIERNIKDAEKSAKVVEKAALDIEKEDKVEKGAKDADTGAKNANIEATEANIEARDANIEAKEADKDANSGETNDKAAEPEIITENAESSSKHDEVSSKDANTSENDKLVKDNETSSKDDSTTEVAEMTEPESNDKRVESLKKVTKDREKSPKEDKNPEKSTYEADKSTEEAEKSTENIEKGPEEAEQKEKSSNKKEDKKKADKNGKEDKSKEKAKESEKRKTDDDKAKEDCAEPRAKRSRETRESKKTEAQPPRSPAKRKPKF